MLNQRACSQGGPSSHRSSPSPRPPHPSRTNSSKPSSPPPSPPHLLMARRLHIPHSTSHIPHRRPIPSPSPPASTSPSPKSSTSSRAPSPAPESPRPRNSAISPSTSASNSPAKKPS